MAKVGRRRNSNPNVHVSFYFEPDLIDNLRSCAEKNDTTLSEEIRRRLWGSLGGSRETVREAKRYEKTWLEQSDESLTAQYENILSGTPEKWGKYRVTDTDQRGSG
jgi:hypothetical protein